MPAITGCCWPRGISTASCSLRCWGGSGRCLCQAGNGRRLRRRRDAGLLKRELLGAVSAKSPPASWNAAIERHSATQTGANGASIVRGRRRPCTRAADRSILTIAGWPKRKFQFRPSPERIPPPSGKTALSWLGGSSLPGSLEDGHRALSTGHNRRGRMILEMW